MVMIGTTSPALIDRIREELHPLGEGAAAYDPLMEMIGDARFVLLGEATHGTHEFYRERARITQRLIQEKGFTAVAVEADWPDAYRVNCYVQGAGSDTDAEAALGGFRRFPAWMWRNTVVRDFVTWLRSYNDGLAPDAPRVGFYGIDLYSLFSSIQAVLNYLERVDPQAAARARDRYSCFDHYGEDSQAYGYAATFGLDRSCEEEVIRALVDLQRQAPRFLSRDGRMAEDDLFFAEQNARVVVNAEQYYRTMFGGRVSSWNLRDRHMVQTLDELRAHLERGGRRAKNVVWAHNSHLGDARATQMGESGEWSVGQLLREQYGPGAVLVGFTTHTGTVTAATSWGGPAERKRVRPALDGSYEALFHRVGVEQFLLRLRDGARAASALGDPRLERAIGVIYRPETERISHYFEARLPSQFDAVLHFDETRALRPLDAVEEWHAGEEAPETYPTGL